jgi:hypothetical protein
VRSSGGGFNRDIFRGVTGNFVFEILKFILGVVFTASTLTYISQVAAINFGYFDQLRWYFLVMIASGGGLLFALVYQRLRRFRPVFPRLDFDYEVIEKNIYYEYFDNTRFLYKKKVKLRALKNGLDIYTDKYSWTGKGSILMKCGVREHSVRETIKKNVWQFYEIRFQRMLSKDDIIEAEVIWELEDTEGLAVPFMSATIEEPTRLLRLHLSLAPSLGVREVTCEVSGTIGTKRPFVSQTRMLDGNGAVVWEISRPSLLYHYEMKWVM